MKYNINVYKLLTVPYKITKESFRAMWNLEISHNTFEQLTSTPSWIHDEYQPILRNITTGLIH